MYIPQLVGEWSLSAPELNWSQRGHSTQSFLVMALVINRLVQLPIACIEDVTMFANTCQLLAGQKAMLNSVLQFSQFCDCSVSSKCGRVGAFHGSLGDYGNLLVIKVITRRSPLPPNPPCDCPESFSNYLKNIQATLPASDWGL